MSYAVALDDAQSISLLYMEGGAFLDFRTADSKAPLHRAAMKGNLNALNVRSRGECAHAPAGPRS